MLESRHAYILGAAIS